MSPLNPLKTLSLEPTGGLQALAGLDVTKQFLNPISPTVKQCPEPPQISNGVVALDSAGTDCGGQAKYTCDK